MADQLGVVLFGDLDINKTVKNINSQIGQIENKLKTVSLSLDINIKSAFKEIENVTNKISKTTKDNINEELRLAEQIAKLREKSESKTQKVSRDNELKQANAINKALEEQYKLEKDIALWKEKQEINISKLSSKGNIDTSELNKLKESLSRVSAESIDARNEMKSFQNELARVNITANESTDSILKTATSYFTLYDAFQLGKQAVRELYTEVLSLDKSLLEIQKVTDIVNLNGFINDAYNEAELLKIAGTDFIDGVAEFSRQGKTIEEAFDLSTISNQMVLVGDNINSVSEAASVLTSALSIFEKQGYTAKDVLDQINQISNKTSSEFSDLADIVRRSSATLGLSGASLEQLLALGTSLQKTLRNSEMVGTSLNAINQKLMGLNDQGQKTVELVAKIGDDMKKLMGIDMMDETTGQMKSTFQILEEMANKWNEVDKNTQLATASLVGNIRHSKSVIALMENWDEVEKSLYESTQATNSSQNELQAYLDSTTGKVEGLKGAMQELYVTTISSDTIGNIAEIVTNIIKLSTELGGLMPIVQTLVGLLITMNAQATGKFLTDITKSFINIGGTAKNLIQIFGNLMLGTQSLSGAMKALNVSASTLAGGGIGLLITAMGALFMHQNKVKAQQEEIRQETARLAEEYSSSVTELSKLKQEYISIIETCKDDKEIKTQLKGIQEKLVTNYAIEKDAIDLVNGSYEKQIELLNDVIDSKSKMALMFAQDNLEDAMNKQALEGKGSYSFYSGMPNDLSDTDKAKIKEIAKQINDEFKDAMNVSFNDELFSLNKITISSSNLKAQEKLLELLRNAGLESDKLYDSFKSMYQENLTLSSNVNKELENRNNILANEVEKYAKVEAGIIDYTQATTEQYDTFIKKAYENIDAMDQDIETKEQLKLIMDGIARESFPQFTDGLSGIDDILGSLNPQQNNLTNSLEDLMDQFTNASDKIATLNTISKELKESNGLSADSFKKIASEFPDLLGYMNDEASLADAIKDKMESLSAVQGDAYRQMLFNSEEYYEQNVLGNEQMINSISSGIENLFRNLSTAYQGDLSNWKTLAQGKADIETQLITSLNKEWEKHFGTLMTQFNKMPNTPIATPQFDEEKARNEIKAKNPHLSHGRVEALVNMARNDFSQQIDEYQQFQAEVVKRNQELSNMFSDVKFDAVDIKIGGNSTKSKKGKEKSNNDLINKLKKQFDTDKAAILKYGEDIEKEIERVNQKIEMAELKGDTKLVESLNIELEALYSTRPDATKKMADELRTLKDKAIQQVNSTALKSDEKLELIADLTADFDEDIAEQSTNWWEYSNALIEHQIKLLELKKEIASEPLDNMQLEISSHENKIKLLELENGTMAEQVTVYNQLLDSEEKRENYLRLTIDDFTKQRDLLDSTSQQYKTLTEYILDFENQLTDSLQAQANAREKLIDMMYDEMELALEKSIYGDDGKDAWEKANSKRIESLNEELDLLKKQSDEKKKQQEAEERLLEIKKLEEQLENAKKQKTVQEFKKQSDGSWQWEYTYDAEKVSELESQLAQKRKEEDQRIEEEKQARKEQSLRDEINRLQKEQRAKEQFYNESKEDLLQYLNDNKDSLIINGEEVLGIVSTNMDNINAEFDTKMELITNSLQEKLAQIKSMFQEALSIGDSIGSIGGGDASSSNGKPVYSNTGGSGKTYFQYGDGSIEVLRPNGTSSTVKPGDKNYSSTVSAMEKDHVKKRYKKGGIVNDTGLMYLDGTDLEPEWVLNAEQTKAFVGSMDSMPEFNENMKEIKELANIAEMRYDFSYARDLSKIQSDIGLNRNNSIGNSITNYSNAPQIHINKIEMHEVNNAKDMAKIIDNELANALSGLPQKAKLVPSGEF